MRGVIGTCRFWASMVSLALLLCASPAQGADPLFNLGWYLQDVVAATTMTRADYLRWRMADPFDSEMDLRKVARRDTVWIDRLALYSDASGASCEDFRKRTFAQWQNREGPSVRQWREAWYGVSSHVDYHTALFNGSKVKRLELAAAVKAPGIPVTAFLDDGSGALKEEFFETSAEFKDAGFDRMRDAVIPLEMLMENRQSCDGFELHVWTFAR